MTNEEKYKTSEERINAFDAFCGQYSTYRDCHIQGDRVVECALNWLTLEAKEEKPIDCPFCGGDSIDIFETDFGQSEEPYQFAVKCKSCGALVSAEDKDAAIAAWNRRAK